jgi:hypothetical protein
MLDHQSGGGIAVNITVLQNIFGHFKINMYLNMIIRIVIIIFWGSNHCGV